MENRWDLHPKEQKILLTIFEKYDGMLRQEGDPVLRHTLAVAGYLYSAGLRDRYIYTALTYELTEFTPMDPAQVEALVGPAAARAIRALDLRRSLGLKEYLEEISGEKVAAEVETAVWMDRLANSVMLDRESRMDLLDAVSLYVLPFSGGLRMGRELKLLYQYVKQFHEQEEQRTLVADVMNVWASPVDDDQRGILDFWFLGDDPVSLSCWLTREDLEEAAGRIGSQVALILTAVQGGEPDVWPDAGEYLRKNPGGAGSEAVLPSGRVFEESGEMIPEPAAWLTGVVQGTGTPSLVENDGVQYRLLVLRIRDMLINALVREDRMEEPRPGQILSGFFSLFGNLVLPDEDIIRREMMRRDRMALEDMNPVEVSPLLH